MKRFLITFLCLFSVLITMSCAQSNSPSSSEKIGNATITNVSNGIRIPLENIQIGERTKCGIDRINVTTGKKEWWIIGITDFSQDYVIDNFVNPGNTYKYEIRYYTYRNENFIKKVVTNEVVATGGVGQIDLSYLKDISFTYDKEQCKLTFDKDAVLSKEIQDKLKDVNLTGNLKIEFRDVRGYYVMDPIATKEMYLDRLLINRPQYLGKNIYLNRFVLDISLGRSNGYFFGYAPEGEKKEFFVKDNSPIIKVEPATNTQGLKIILPETLPKDTKYLSIRRRSSSSNAQYYDYEISITQLPVEEIIDPFVNPNCEYSYMVSFAHPNPPPATDGWEFLARSKWTSNVKAVTGIGEITLDSDTEIIHNPNTGISTISKPFNLNKYLSQDSSLKASSMIDIAYSVNNSWYRGSILNNEINWGEIVRYYPFGSSDSITLQSQKIEIYFEKKDNSNIRYETFIYHDNLQNVLKSYPETITIKNPKIKK